MQSSPETDKKGYKYEEAKDYKFPEQASLQMLEDFRKLVEEVKAGNMTPDQIKDVVELGGVPREMIDLVKAAADDNPGARGEDNKEIAEKYLGAEKRLNMAPAVAQNVWQNIALQRNTATGGNHYTAAMIEAEDHREVREAGYKLVQAAVEIGKGKGLLDYTEEPIFQIDLAGAPADVQNVMYGLENQVERVRNGVWDPNRNKDEINELRNGVTELMAVGGADALLAAEAVRKRIANLEGKNYGDLEKMVPGECECGQCGRVMSATGDKCPRDGSTNVMKLTPEEFKETVKHGLAGFGERRLEDIQEKDSRIVPLAEDVNGVIERFKDSPEDLLKELERLDTLMRGFYLTGGAVGLDVKETMEELVRAARVLGQETKAAVRGSDLEKQDTEEKLILYWRSRIRDAVESLSGAGLTTKGVIDVISAKEGFDPKTFRPVELVPQGFAEDKAKALEKLRREINARIELKMVLDQEEEYKRATDKNATIKRYIADHKGSETGKSNATIISRDTYRWLRELEDVGDGLAVDRVDAAFAVMLALGEGTPDYFVGKRWEQMQRFARDGAGKNFYDEKYDPAMRRAAEEELRVNLGEDAVILAKQLWAAYKEESNYNTQHYLNGLVRFADARHFLATKLVPPVFTGSRRVYVEGTGTYLDQIPSLAMTGLDARIKIFGADRVRFLREAAKNGRLLQDVPLDDASQVEKSPQIASFGTVKNADSYRDTVKAIGELEKPGDRAGKAQAAATLLAELRDKSVAMVEDMIVHPDWYNRQLLEEAKNAAWALSTRNPLNVQDKDFQAKDKPGFLTPTGWVTYFQLAGGRTASGNAILGSSQDFGQPRSNEVEFRSLRSYVEQLRKESWDVYKDLPGGVDDVIDKERKAKDMKLPEVRGAKAVVGLTAGGAATNVVFKPVEFVADIVLPWNWLRPKKNTAFKAAGWVVRKILGRP